MGHGQHWNLNFHLLGLTDRQGGALGVTGNDQNVRLQGFHLIQRSGHVVQFRRQFVVNDNFHIVFFDHVLDAQIDVLRKWIVFKRHGDFNAGRIAAFGLGVFGRQIDRFRQILF